MDHVVIFHTSPGPGLQALHLRCSGPHWPFGPGPTWALWAQGPGVSGFIPSGIIFSSRNITASNYFTTGNINTGSRIITCSNFITASNIYTSGKYITVCNIISTCNIITASNIYITNNLNISGGNIYTPSNISITSGSNKFITTGSKINTSSVNITPSN